MKKVLKSTVLLLAVIAVFFCAFIVNADEQTEVTIVDSGAHGDIYWKLTSDSTLIFSGEGSIPGGH